MKRLYGNLIEFINLSKPKKLNIGICTTSDVGIENFTSYMSYPREIKKNEYYAHCIFFNDNEAIQFIKKLKFLNTIFFLDIENKTKLFNWTKIRDNFKNKINFNYIQPNFITTKGIIESVINENYENILVIGSGNIARELSFRFKIIGQKFFWTNIPERRKSKNIDLMNFAFPKNKLDKFILKFDCIINTIPLNTNINFSKLITEKTTFIEVTGKSIDYVKKLNCRKLRFDFSPYLVNEIKNIKSLNSNSKIIGRRRYKNYFICSGGYLGEKNDLIVDNYITPSFVIGIADGNGGFMKRINISIQNY